MLDPIELGRRIATARTAIGLTQEEFAKKIGFKHGTEVSRYERGHFKRIPVRRLDLIAEVTGRPRSFFEEEPPIILPRAELEAIKDYLAALEETVAALARQVAELVAQRAADGHEPGGPPGRSARRPPASGRART